MTYPMIPGVPAAGHVSRGFWHPGPEQGCQKCAPMKTVQQERDQRKDKR